jgi:hypothetical protein
LLLLDINHLFNIKNCNKGGVKMKGLKVVLWICAVACLLGFVAAAFPWRVIISLCQWVGVEPPTPDALTVYVFRLFMAMFGLIGVFFVILARDPLKYGAMLRLAAYGLLSFGIFCLVGGIKYPIPLFAYLGDFIFGVVAGLLLLVFRRKAMR